MSEKKIDNTRRNLIVATAAVSGAAGAAVAVPFAWSWWPSERAKAAGAPVEADISEPRAGRTAGGRVARQAGVDRAPHQGNARGGEEGRRQGHRPEVRGAAAARVREERIPLDQARSPGAGRHLLAPGLLAAVEDRPRPRPRWAPTGRAASSAPATAPSSTSPAASTRARRRRSTSTCRRTPTCRTARILIGDDKKGA